MTKTETYMRGMNDINSFYSMLHAAMRTSMPDAQISQSGAYVWRGYRIDAFRNLAHGLYYCQIYPHDPRRLVFEEGYQDPKRKATDLEFLYEVQQGRYYYPFADKLDLYRTRFFDFSKAEQFRILKTFISGAVKKALLWQREEIRGKYTGKKYLNPSIPRLIPVKVQQTYEQVGEDFFYAWEYQNELFDKFKKILEKNFLKNKITTDQWVRPNASIYNFGFRGLRMKFESESTTSRWSIYFKEGESKRLKFQIPGRPKNSYDLVLHKYFDLSPSAQTEHLREFAEASLGKKR